MIDENLINNEETQILALFSAKGLQLLANESNRIEHQSLKYMKYHKFFLNSFENNTKCSFSDTINLLS